MYDKNEIAVEDVNNFVNWATLQSMIEEAVNSNNLRLLLSTSSLLQFVSLDRISGSGASLVKAFIIGFDNFCDWLERIAGLFFQINFHINQCSCKKPTEPTFN